MRNLKRSDVTVRRVLDRARTVAVVGASGRRSDRSWTAIDYLKRSGFDVIPIREDGASIHGIPSFAALGQVPGQVDVVLVYQARGREVDIVDAATAKRATAVWLAPGLATREAERRARASGIEFVKERDPIAEHRPSLRDAGQPTKLGVREGRRKLAGEKTRRRGTRGNYAEAGGGGRRGGGGGRAVVDEKKMAAPPASRAVRPQARRRVA